MKKLFILSLVSFLYVMPTFSQIRTLVKMGDYPLEKRRMINIPDILGYTVLKCDFHMHTLNSDGEVTAATRVQEAWEEGLDAISITDHIAHKKGAKDENQGYDLGRKDATEKDILLIKGGEITFPLNPGPGHANALFLQDVNKLQTDDWRETFSEAKKQGAFIFWNHPGWTVDSIRWYEEQSELYNNGLLNGIEVFNEFEFYPEAVNWCLAKNLTFISNSDVHSAIDRLYDFNIVKHQPMTLVLSSEKTEKALKEALLAGRTLIYAYNLIAGKEEYVKALYDASVKQVTKKPLDSGKTLFIFSNESDIDYILKRQDIGKIPEDIVILGRSTVNVMIENEDIKPSVYVVENVFISGYDNLHVTLFQ